MPTGALVRCVVLISLIAPFPLHGDDPVDVPPPAFQNDRSAYGLDVPLRQVILADLDGDGWLDCIANSRQVFLQRPDLSGADPSGKRHFIEFTEKSGIHLRPSHLPPSLPADGDDHPTDLVESSNALVESAPSFVVCGDVDNDGDLDLFSGVRSELEFWRKDEATGEPVVGPDGLRVPVNPDRGWRNEIMLNDGEGRFTVVAQSGVSAVAETSCAATFLDFDLDGVLDLFVGNWYQSYGWSYDAYPDRLYRGQGDGTFVDVTEAAGLSTQTEAGTRTSTKPTYGVGCVDWNGDRFPDLFSCSYGRQWNQQWRNNGDGTFTEVAESTSFDGDAVRSGHYPENRREPELPFRANGNTFDVSFADFDNDGDFDAFLGEITHAWAGSSSDPSTLLVNLGVTEGFRFERRDDAGIVRAHEGERWNQGDIFAGWIDANGDGREDLFISSSDYPDDQRLRLFVQNEAHQFEDRTAAFGLDWPASSMPSVGDVDGDGDPDLLVARSLSRLSKDVRDELGDRGGLWINGVGDGQSWCTVRLRGRGAGGCNARGIGCRVAVQVGDRLLHRAVQSASGHTGHQNPDDLLIGLGSSDRIESLTVYWANAAGTESVIEGFGANQRVTIFEPEGDAPARVEFAPLAP